MATTFKTLLNNDVTSTRTLLHEAIPITGTIVSGTYSETSTTTSNIKNYGHAMFQSVYDYPYLSSSANHIFDITVGYSNDSHLSKSSAVASDQAKKINLYNQMAQLLVGHDVTGNIRLFDQDGDLTAGNKMREVFFVNYARLLNKDEVKKGSYSISFLTGGTNLAAGRANLMSIADHNAQNEFRINSPAGEYGILYTSSAAPNSTSGVGHIYYQAGIAVLTASIFGDMRVTIPGGFGKAGATYDTSSVEAVMSGSNITASCDGLRNRWSNSQYNNTTELNSTIYFCRANHNDFNYSTNPTYLSGSKIRIKNNTFDTPVSYITTVGLYSADNELLAVAKLSEPIKKQPDTELTLRVRLDY